MKQEVSKLSQYKLSFEAMENEMGKKPAKTTKKDKVIKKTVTERVVTKVKTTFSKVVDKSKSKIKKTKKPTKADVQAIKDQRKRGILGIGLLLVIVSIAYTTSVTFILVDSRASTVALLPQVAFAIYISSKAFSKLFK